MIYTHSYRGGNFGRFPGGGLGCLIFGALLFVGGYYILKGLYYLLWWAAPALLVLALIINWRVFLDTFKNWLNTLETKPLSGLVSAAFAVLLFPVFALYLFLKALGGRKMEQLRREFGDSPQAPREEEFVEFEEIESRPKGDTRAENDPLEPPPAEPTKVAPKKPENPYDTFFGH
jgi:hypothetical protein